VSSVRWSIQEVGPDSWWVVDERSGTALKLSSAEGLRLWGADSEMRSAPLAEARLLARTPDAPFVDLEFLGVHVRYWCGKAEWAEEIARQYCGMLPQVRRSPDADVALSDPLDFERLHRSVEGVRTGVAVRVCGSDWEEGSSSLPIIPLLQTAAFRERFCAMHGALLATDDGGVLVCGEQKAGKTTTALIARDLGLATILSDEMTLVDRDGGCHGVPLPIRERCAGGGRLSQALESTTARARDRGTTLRAIVTLHRSNSGASGTRQLVTDAAALRALSPHMRVLDTSLGEASMRLLRLLRTAKVWSVSLREWPLIREDISATLRLVLGHKP